MTDTLTIDEFTHLVASYGAHPDRWPDGQRAAAVQYLVISEAARNAWQEASNLDQELDNAAAADVTAQLIEQVTSIADTPAHGRTGFTPRLIAQGLPYAAAAAIALIIGLAAPSPFRDAGAPGSTVVAVVDDSQTPATAPNSLDGLALVDTDIFSFEVDQDSDEFNVANALSVLPLL